MTPERLREIKRNATSARSNYDMQLSYHRIAICDWVPELLAEVEQLSAKLTEMDEAAVRAIRAEANAVRELEQENARLRADLGRPVTDDERAFLDGV